MENSQKKQPARNTQASILCSRRGISTTMAYNTHQLYCAAWCLLPYPSSSPPHPIIPPTIVGETTNRSSIPLGKPPFPHHLPPSTTSHQPPQNKIPHHPTIMGSAPSRPVSKKGYHNWDAEGGYIPFRHQGAHRRRWAQEDHEADRQQRREEKARHDRRYDEVGRKKAEFRKQYDDRFGHEIRVFADRSVYR